MNRLISNDVPQILKSKSVGDNLEIEFPKADVESSVPERFDKIVRYIPEQTAIKSWEIEFTYKQFDRITNQLARVILRQNQSLENPVAFLLGNGAMPIIAIFGILKAGGFYVSLDPSFPSDRLKYMLEDSRSKMIITDHENHLAARELSQNKLKIINLDNLDPGISDENLNIKISPDALACLQYTSGSTGRPKGVMLDHRYLLHITWDKVNSCGFNPDDRIALLHPIGFAASITPIFGSLLSGATLFPFDLKDGLTYLADWLLEKQITVFGSVPTLYRHVVRSQSEGEIFPHLRLVTLGGEAVLKSDVDLYKRYFSDNSLLRHGIGGTEMGMIRRFWIDKRTEILDDIVPIGYAVEDKEVLIVDEDGNQVGFDEVGEMVIRSRYLSPGYWKRPDLTKSKFRDDPVHEGFRLYWTGDLGRMREDGCLFHLGRKDFQIKIRGFRVELVEIESVLMQYPGIQEAVVITNERPGSEMRLIAYVVYDQEHPFPTTEDLRIFLKKKVPDYMVPFAFVTLDSMPLTPTGKTDRLALPTLEDVFQLDRDYEPPRDEIEMKLVSIWEQVLGLSPIGIHNDFFQLGGHSLSAAKLITETEAAFDKNFDLALLSEAVTIEGMAKILREDGQSVAKTALVSINSSGTRPNLYCVHGVGGHVIPFMKLAEYLGSDQPVYGLQVKSFANKEPNGYSIEQMAGEYLEEIRSMQPGGPYYLAGFSFGGFVAYEMARQLSAKGQQVGMVGIFDTQAANAPGYINSLSYEKKITYHTKRILNKVNYHSQNLKKLHASEVVPYLRNRQVRPTMHEAIMGDVEMEQVPEHLLGIINANMAAMRKYAPGEYKGKVIVFKSNNHGRGVYYGWEELVSGGVEVHYVPGNHRGILQEPNVAHLAEILRNCIDKTLIPEVH